jgi:hypothetical protein
MEGFVIARLALLLSLLVLLPTSAAVADQPPFAHGGSTYAIPSGPLGADNASHAVPPQGPVPHSVTTVPMWESTFQSGGQTWGSLMVGTDPAAGSATTTIPVTIVPLALTFARDGSTLSQPGMAEDLAGSALFQPFPFITGTTQYGDAFRRGDFWDQVSTTSPGYHTLLGGPAIRPLQHWTVPAAKGVTFVNPAAGRRFGIVEGAWFSHQLGSAISSLRIDPRSLVIFLAYNTDVAYVGDPASCLTTGCSLLGGVHGALLTGSPQRGDQPPQYVNTYAYASYEDLGNLVPDFLHEHLVPVSHEIVEWLDDPLSINVDPSDPFGLTFSASSVPSWSSPFYLLGCSSAYEVADPLEAGAPAVGVPTATGFDLFAAAVFQSWFARRSPSNAIAGLYDTAGVFQTYSDSC